LVVVAEFLVSNIDNCRKTGEVDIYLVRIPSFLMGENVIAGTDAFNTVLKCVRKACLIEKLVDMRRRGIYPEIAGRLGRINRRPAGGHKP